MFHVNLKYSPRKHFSSTFSEVPYISLGLKMAFLRVCMKVRCRQEWIYKRKYLTPVFKSQLKKFQAVLPLLDKKKHNRKTFFYLQHTINLFKCLLFRHFHKSIVYIQTLKLRNHTYNSKIILNPIDQGKLKSCGDMVLGVTKLDAFDFQVLSPRV